MNVVYITNVLSPYRNDFFNLLAVDFPKLSVITYGESEELLAWKNENYNKKYIHIDLKGNKFSKLIYLINVLNKKSKSDIFILGGYGSIYESFLLILGKLYKKKVILNIDGYCRENSFPIKNLKVFLINLASKVIVSGYVTKKNLISDGVKNDITVYFFSSTFISEFHSGYTEKDFDLLFVGSLSERKGIYNFLKFFVGSGLKLKLGLIGDGPLYDDLRIFCSGYSNIFFLGRLSRHEVFDFLRNSKILLVPSLKDIWGLVVNEGITNNITLLSSKEVMSSFDLLKEGINGFFLDLKFPHEITKERINLALNINSKIKTSYNKDLASLYCIENMVIIHKKLIYGE